MYSKNIIFTSLTCWLLSISVISLRTCVGQSSSDDIFSAASTSSLKDRWHQVCELFNFTQFIQYLISVNKIWETRKFLFLTSLLIFWSISVRNTTYHLRVNRFIVILSAVLSFDAPTRPPSNTSPEHVSIRVRSFPVKLVSFINLRTCSGSFSGSEVSIKPCHSSSLSTS